jgi:hypothetical protein
MIPEIKFTSHALQQCQQRDISQPTALAVAVDGEIISEHNGIRKALYGYHVIMIGNRIITAYKK